jgi:hypothetical protein
MNMELAIACICEFRSKEHGIAMETNASQKAFLPQIAKIFLKKSFTKKSKIFIIGGKILFLLFERKNCICKIFGNYKLFILKIIMDTLSVRSIGKPVNYIKCDILSNGDQKTCQGILKRIYKRNIYANSNKVFDVFHQKVPINYDLVFLSYKKLIDMGYDLNSLIKNKKLCGL